MERVHSAGAKFDYEKAKWFNHEWIKRLEVGSLKLEVKTLLLEKGIIVTDDTILEKVIGLVKDRCQLLTDFVQQSDYFFKAPETIDTAAVKPKWNEAKNLFFAELIRNYALTTDWEAHTLENNLKEIAAVNDLKPGELMLPLRICLLYTSRCV